MRDIQFFAQFCDDIRREQDGRLSLMGVYPGAIQIRLEDEGEAPKVCMHATLIIPLEVTLETVSIKTEWNESEVLAFDLPSEAVSDLVGRKDVAPQDSKHYILNMAAEMKNLKLDGDGTLTAIAKVNSHYIKAVPLKVTVIRSTDLSEST